MSQRAFDWVAVHARRTPARVAMREPRGRVFTYAAFDETASRLAGVLAGRGVGPGDRVAILAPNLPEVFLLEFACWRLGAIMLPLNWRLARPELEFIAADAEPAVLLLDPDHADLGRGLAPVMVEIGSQLDALLAAGADPPPPVEAGLDDVVTILYTAGTTGRPKGALITHRMNLFNAINIGAATRLTSDSVHLTVLPTFHTGGLNLLANPALHLGAEVVIPRGFEAGQALDLLSDPDQGVTHFFGVPAMYLVMAQHPEFQRTDLSRLVYAGVGGAPSPLSLLETYAARGAALTNGYGMTETGPTAIILTPERALAKVGSVGMPVLHIEVRLRTAAGADAGPGETGELWLRGPSITPGYWRRPEATAEAIVDGWLRTGDAARVDQDGCYTIVDRWKDMYISGGENVYPAEVENAIYELAEVAEAAVVGVPDPRWGEVGCAYVVVKPGRQLDAARVIDHCRSRLARFKVPARVTFMEILPRNAAGKVLKRELDDARPS